MNLLRRCIIFTVLPLVWTFTKQEQQTQRQNYIENDYECLTDSLYSPRHASADLSGILDFELGLFQRLSSLNTGRNVFFSPYSIWNALVMAYLGSSGRTENQFKYALGLIDKKSSLRLLRQLQLKYKIRSIRERGSNVLQLVNRIYFDDSVAVRSCMEGVLHSEIYTIDFNMPTQAAEAINAFVSETTRGKIAGIVTPSALEGILMAIVNAAYFKGAWLYPFDPQETSVEEFTTVNGKKILVDMMSQYGEFLTASDEGLQADVIEFPYFGESMAMYIFKPHLEGQIHLDNLIMNLTKVSLLRVMNVMNETFPRTARLALPRFKIETLIEDELKVILEGIGITDAFDAGLADFRDFSTNNFISLRKGIHKAYVEVNEEGTEAAGVTVFISTKIGGIKFFDCNRPFVFAIVDKETSNVLFIGSLLEPEPITRKPKANPTSQYSP